MSKTPSFAPTVRLDIQINNGRITFVGGESLPAFKEGAIGQLILDASALKHDADRLRLTREAATQILAKGDSLWARVAIDTIPVSLKAHRENKTVSSGAAYGFVRMILRAPLKLIGSEGKLPVLDECDCGLPALPHVACASVNEAYTRISEAFEPSRRSHTGNVFSCVFFEQGGSLYPLKKLRNSRPAASDEKGQSSFF
jgi:hypothetical protein